MRKELEVGGKTVEFVANAATPYRFRMVFHKDLLTLLSKATDSDMTTVETITELAFIMAKQAEGVDMAALTEKEYAAWLEDFEPDTFLDPDTIIAILGVYNKNAITASKSKKKNSK